MAEIDRSDPLQVQVAGLLDRARLLPPRSRGIEAPLRRWLERPGEKRRGAWYLAALLHRRLAAAARGN